MPTKSSKARSPSPDSSGRILCIDDRSLSFSNTRHYPSHNKTYSISERPLPERLRLVAQIVLVPLRRRRHESTNRAGHLWTVGEDYRSNLIAEQYAIRLNLHANNLIQSSRVDGLDMLLRGYPSHRFVIDRKEARKLFRNVDAPTGKIAELAQSLGTDVTMPRSITRKELPKLEYLNAEDTTKTKAAAKPGRRRGSGRK